MSREEIQIIVREAVLATLNDLGYKKSFSEWVTFNRALTILKSHGIGRKRLSRALIEKRVNWKTSGRNILIERKTLNNLI